MKKGAHRIAVLCKMRDCENPSPRFWLIVSELRAHSK